MAENLHIVVLAAGRGTRMVSDQPKVLAPLGEWPLLRHVVTTAEALSPAHIHVVYGAGADAIQSALGYLAVNWVEQPEQLGTGNAVACALPEIPDSAQVLVLYGDVPLLTTATLSHLVAAAGAECYGVLTADLDEPTGYGRIVRDDANRVIAIVEDKDLTEAQRAIREVNTGVVAVPAGRLRTWLGRINNDNAQGEYLLTDCLADAVADGVSVVAEAAGSIVETQGVNDRRDLARAERLYQARRTDALLAAGATLRDPARVDVRGNVRVGRDVLIDVDVVLEGDVALGDRVHIEPGAVLRQCEVGDGCRIMAYSVLENARVGVECQVGPFARVRPGTELARRAKIGNFVETKNAVIGESSKINHLSYIGDARLGSGVNVGAGVITCNYDGASKHETIIGDRAFIGSSSQLIAPVEVGAGATVGAGTTLTKNAPAEQLSLTRKEQRVINNWQRPRKS